MPPPNPICVTPFGAIKPKFTILITLPSSFIMGLPEHDGYTNRSVVIHPLIIDPVGSAYFISLILPHVIEFVSFPKGLPIVKQKLPLRSLKIVGKF